MTTLFKAQALTVELVRAGSVTGSEGERMFPEVLLGILRRLPYFQTHPQDVWAEGVANDPHARQNVFALVRGQGAATVVLTGHYDVVDVDNYGPHADDAFNPEVLKEHLIADLLENARSEAEYRALADLQGGHFLPGRGALDMKSGLAAGIVALERHSLTPEEGRVGNVLFLAVADEEVSSHGARAAAPSLLHLAEKYGLDIRGVINLDATGDNGDGSAGQALYTGTVGKLLLSAFVVGVDTHAGYSLDGINVNFLASELARAFEVNPALTDDSYGIQGTPPTLLRQMDLKTHYDVTTPARAWLCVNALVHGWPAHVVMDKFKAVAAAAMQDGLSTLRARADALGQHSAAHGATPLVMTYAELEAEAAKHVSDLENALDEYNRTLSTTLDYPTRSAKLTSWLWDKAGLLGPAVVLGFASLHYPATRLDEQDASEGEFLRVVRNALARTAEQHGTRVSERPVFTGISDMSWFGRADTTAIPFVNQNTPVRAARIHAPPAGLPCVNLGPWGRDYHQWLERAHIPYCFTVLPELAWEVTGALLSGKQ